MRARKTGRSEEDVTKQRGGKSASAGVYWAQLELKHTQLA